jgi:DNA polymerase III delta subunit
MENEEKKPTETSDNSEPDKNKIEEVVEPTDETEGFKFIHKFLRNKIKKEFILFNV